MPRLADWPKHGLLLCCDWFSTRHPRVLCSTAKNRSSSPNWSAIFVGIQCYTQIIWYHSAAFNKLIKPYRKILRVEQRGHFWGKVTPQPRISTKDQVLYTVYTQYIQYTVLLPAAPATSHHPVTDADCRSDACPGLHQLLARLLQLVALWNCRQSTKALRLQYYF